MKKLLKLIAIVLASFALAVSVRAGLRRWFPGTYASIWGTLPAPALVQKERPSTTSAPLSPEPLLNSTQSKGEQSQKQEGLYLTGILRHGRRVVLVMSDGSVRTDEDNVPRGTVRLTYVTRTFMDWDGERYWVKPKSSTGGKEEEKSKKDLTLVPAPS